jgi:hypothetical protein
MIATGNANRELGGPNAMTHDEALDEETRVTVNQAIRELKAHGWRGFVSNYQLYADNNDDDYAPEIIARVEGDEVSARAVMVWLGY